MKGIMTSLLCVLSVILVTTVASADNKMTVSIGQFKNKSGANPVLFDTLVDRITNSIVNTRKFTVVDEARVKEALDGRQLVDSGLASSEGAPQYGKMKAAGYRLYGTVLSLGEDSRTFHGEGFTAHKTVANVELNLRFMDIESGELLASKVVTSSATGKDYASSSVTGKGSVISSTIEKAVQHAAKKVTDELMELAFPMSIIKVGSKDVVLNIPKERAKESMVLAVFSVGEELTDPDTGESLGADEERLGEIKITKVLPKFSRAVPIGSLELSSIEKGMHVRKVAVTAAQKKAAAKQAQTTTRFRKRF